MSTVSIGSANTPIGVVWAAASEDGLAAVALWDEPLPLEKSLARRGFQPVLGETPQLEGALRQIIEYLNGDRRGFDLAIDWTGLAPFHRQVLQQVLAIPYGQVSTYGEIAQALGQPRAARAVGRANATNPLTLVVPCHRLLGSDGKLRGYGARGGLETKAWLLRMERGGSRR